MEEKEEEDIYLRKRRKILILIKINELYLIGGN